MKLLLKKLPLKYEKEISCLVFVCIALTLIISTGCGANEENVKNYMESVCHYDVGNAHGLEEVELVKVDLQYEPLAYLPIVIVTKNAIRVDGNVIVAGRERILKENPQRWSLHLKEALDLWKLFPWSRPADQIKSLLLAVTPTSETQTVRVLLNAASELGYKHAVLLFDPVTPLSIPEAPEPAFAIEIATATTREQATRIAKKQLDEAITYCPEVTTAISGSQFIFPDKRCDVLTEVLPGILSSWLCWVDENKILSIIHAMFVSPERTPVGYKVDINSLVTDFLIGETETWNDVVPRVLNKSY